MKPGRSAEAARRSLETRKANALARIHSRADEIRERCPMTWFRRRDCALTQFPGMTVEQVREEVQRDLLAVGEKLTAGAHSGR